MSVFLFIFVPASEKGTKERLKAQALRRNNKIEFKETFNRYSLHIRDYRLLEEITIVLVHYKTSFCEVILFPLPRVKKGQLTSIRMEPTLAVAEAAATARAAIFSTHSLY